MLPDHQPSTSTASEIRLTSDVLFQIGQHLDIETLARLQSVDTNLQKDPRLQLMLAAER